MNEELNKKKEEFEELFCSKTWFDKEHNPQLRLSINSSDVWQWIEQELIQAEVRGFKVGVQKFYDDFTTKIEEAFKQLKEKE